MSTWNVLTLSRTDGQDVDLDALRELLPVHGFESALDAFDGESLDYGWCVDLGTSRTVADQTQARAAWWSKWTEGDAGDLSAALGKDWTVEHAQEWDDEEPGAEVGVWIDGHRDVIASQAKRNVSDALAHLDFTDTDVVAKILAILPAPETKGV